MRVPVRKAVDGGRGHSPVRGACSSRGCGSGNSELRRTDGGVWGGHCGGLRAEQARGGHRRAGRPWLCLLLLVLLVLVLHRCCCGRYYSANRCLLPAQPFHQQRHVPGLHAPRRCCRRRWVPATSVLGPTDPCPCTRASSFVICTNNPRPSPSSRSMSSLFC